ncbi:hypothetical protein BSLG_006027 [Batrachochytrium salamandrivorans]|nr:hypothetical protein BSLG_006027 [Batrachochytrium salamandrivorans]
MTDKIELWAELEGLMVFAWLLNYGPLCQKHKCQIGLDLALPTHIRLKAGLAPPHWNRMEGETAGKTGYSTMRIFDQVETNEKPNLLLKRQQYSNGQLTQQQNDTKLRRVVQLNMLLKSRKWKNSLFMEVFDLPALATIEIFGQNISDLKK